MARSVEASRAQAKHGKRMDSKKHPDLDLKRSPMNDVGLKSHIVVAFVKKNLYCILWPPD
jgi:hypothetical protein